MAAGPGRPGGRADNTRDECSAAVTEPGARRAGGSPADVVDYRPKSTVVGGPAAWCRARSFPGIDIHNHTRITPDNIEPDQGDGHLRVLNNLSGGNGNGLKGCEWSIRNSRYANGFTLLVNVDWEGAGGAPRSRGSKEA